MTCRRCGHANEAGANFCSSCGAPLAAGAGPDDTTASLAALEERHELDEELGSALAELPVGMGMLVVRRGPNAGSRYLLDDDTIAVGRHPDSEIFLDDITVSRRHAVVRRLGAGGYDVNDVGSLNGTYVNHERVETAPLHYLDELQVGRFVLTFLVGGAAESGEA
ncbi:MAG: FHA domain-containing protein [Actinobacteria bacterium]|nr:FHA domain-containing protein [Actinomycetota bacterium]